MGDFLDNLIAKIDKASPYIKWGLLGLVALLFAVVVL